MHEQSLINFQFPGFSLQVSYNQHAIIGAKFMPPDSTLSTTLGAKTELSEQIVFELTAYRTNPLWQFKLPLDYACTPHQLQVWQIMQTIQPGKVLSYGEVAKQIGSAARAVGGACGANPIPVIIPCHRIIAANGNLGGFNSGHILFSLGIKKWLLQHEGIKLNT